VRTISSKRPWNSERGISRIGSSGGTISALGDFPKLFILAKATLSIRETSLLGNPGQVLATPGPESIFITTIIGLNYFDIG
jgi:hypothetical protein